MNNTSINWFWSKYEDYRQSVNTFISKYISNLNIPVELKDASSHLILSGGKRVRPIFVLSVNELLGGDVNHALPVASAIEFLHNFTLIHDDIMDQDMFRRGVKTTHILYGVSTAILAGDYLFSLVFGLVARNYSGDEARYLTQLLAEASENICVGQAMDIKPESYVKDVDSYLKMIYLKTASLIEASTASGAVVSGRLDLVDEFKLLGKNVGIAFQVADDILGLIGDPSKTGKPVGNDIRNGKRTLPILYSLPRMDDDDKRFFLNVFGRGDASDEDVEEATKLIVKYGGIEYSRDFMMKYSEEAKKILDNYPDSEAKHFLINLINFIVTREK